MKLPYSQDRSDRRALSQIHRAFAWRLHGKCHAPGAAPSKYSVKIHRSLFPMSVFHSFKYFKSPINHSDALILYNIIMQYIYSYRRLYLDKGRAPLFELDTRIHAAACIPRLWFHSISCPLFAPAGLISGALLCSFASPFFTPIHFSASAFFFSAAVVSRKWAWPQPDGHSSLWGQ